MIVDLAAATLYHVDILTSDRLLHLNSCLSYCKLCKGDRGRWDSWTCQSCLQDDE